MRKTELSMLTYGSGGNVIIMGGSIMRVILISVLIGLLGSIVSAGEFVPDAQPPTYKDNTAVQTSRGVLDCSNVIELEWDVTEYHSTVGMPSNVDEYPCSTWDESGPEMVFHFSTEGQSPVWHVSFTPIDVDLDLILIRSVCDEEVCWGVFDGGFYASEAEPGDFYIVVDGYQGAAGAFELTVGLPDIPGPLPSACLDFESAFPGASGEIVPAGAYPFGGEVCMGDPNHLQRSDCIYWLTTGPDTYREMVLLAGASVEITAGYTIRGDAVLYLVDTCENSTTGQDPQFLACSNSTEGGFMEYLTYTNLTGQNQVVYLVIDTLGDFGPESCEYLDGEILLTYPGAVANENAAWGSIKSMYR